MPKLSFNNVAFRAISDDEILSIGYACHNTQRLVFEQTDDEPPCYHLITPADVGQKGVLLVRGSSLSLGYYGNQSQTQTRFIQTPPHHNYLDRLYDTGDIEAYNPRGELVCYGRADGQIKYQSNRIELGEIEAVVSGHPEVPPVPASSPITSPCSTSVPRGKNSI